MNDLSFQVRRSLITASFAVTVVLAIGCAQEEYPQAFEPNLVHAMKYEITEGIPMSQPTKDAMWVVTTMFGTPDAPKIPKFITENEELASIVSMERLMRASGPEDAEGRGLFRKHCANCHGVTGNGRGPQAAVQIPYPRDYRKGIFKFTSTPRSVKPTRDDLAKLIGGGIAGTMMKKIPELTEEDVQALVDYVIYLSWRGELERDLIESGVMDLDLAGGDRIIHSEAGSAVIGSKADEVAERLTAILDDVEGQELMDYENYLAFAERWEDMTPSQKSRLEKAVAGDEESESDEPLTKRFEKDLRQYENYLSVSDDLESDEELKATLEAAKSQTSGPELLFFESWQYYVENAEDIANDWLDADDEVVEVPDPPAGLPVAGSRKEYVEMSKGDQATQLAASVQRGKELFTGKIANCSKCHGAKGLGDGQTTDYDEWTKDWTSRVNLKPDDREALIPLLARGALPPVNAVPRNFQEGIFRGGSSSGDLYLRITQGIDGTPMPAVTFVDGQFEPDDVWHIINFIRSLQTQDAPVDDPAASSTATTEPTPAA